MKIEEKQEAIRKLATRIDSHQDWWRFPSQGPIQGFMGTDPIFIVGDQPSRSEWRSEHPNRRTFYGTLQKLEITNAHLTDIYKKRGECSALKKGLPRDFDEHVALFCEEIEILQPTIIIALGDLAYNLLTQKLPACRNMLKKVVHFSYATRSDDPS